MVVAKKYVLVKAFDGFPNNDNIEFQEETLLPLKDGEVLFEALFLSVDPYMRLFPIAVGSVMIGEQVSKVVESRHSDYAVGSLHVAKFGWRSHTVVHPKDLQGQIQHLPDMEGLSPSLGLGAVGMPGQTAYHALLDYGQLKEGDTVVVTAAAGAVGSVIGQIARIKNCTTIGFAGTEAKVAWLKELGYTHAFNYKTCNLGEVLTAAAPNGANVYIDHVGGDMATEIINNHMAVFGRAVIVGSISAYNATTPQKLPGLFHGILMKQLTIRGFMHPSFSAAENAASNKDVIHWIKEGRLAAREHVTKGFENMREAFYGLFKGENIGKAIIEV